MQLCAACKTRTAQTIAASAALPIDVFGENHVEELRANYDAGASCGKPSHFIGHLQTNKIKKVLGRASPVSYTHLMKHKNHISCPRMPRVCRALVVRRMLRTLLQST